MDTSLITQYGVAGLMFTFIIVMWKWLSEQMGKILEREHIEREKWQGIILGFQNCIAEHTAQAKSFHDEVAKAHDAQWKEHEDIEKKIDKILALK